MTSWPIAIATSTGGMVTFWATTATTGTDRPQRIHRIEERHEPQKPSPLEERRASRVKQHLAYLSTPTAELVKGLKR